MLALQGLQLLWAIFCLGESHNVRNLSPTEVRESEDQKGPSGSPVPCFGRQPYHIFHGTACQARGVPGRVESIAGLFAQFSGLLLKSLGDLPF